MTEQKNTDASWLWRSFGLATPYSFGRSLTLADIKPSENELSSHLTLPAITMNRLLRNRDYNPKVNTQHLSSETLYNILEYETGSRDLLKAREYLKNTPRMRESRVTPEEKEENENIYDERVQLEQLIAIILSNELDRGSYREKEYPIHNLVNGILHNENWTLLSDEDTSKWMSGYGAVMSETGAQFYIEEDHPDVTQDSKLEDFIGHAIIRIAIQQQNSMLRELHPEEFETRGQQNLFQLIQPEYDIDFGKSGSNVGLIKSRYQEQKEEEEQDALEPVVDTPIFAYSGLQIPPLTTQITDTLL